MKRNHSKNRMNRWISAVGAMLFVCGIVCDTQPVKAWEENEAYYEWVEEQAEEELEAEKVTVVIDPGHGGENLGGEYGDYTEKDMTIVVAKAMKAELEQYEGVEVYLTRSGDQKLSLDERCAFAESVDADFLFCLHFNMSENHTLFGAECWVSAFGEMYSKGYSFASAEMELLQEMGLYSRGIKTRLNQENIDYYGIIRHATERGIPCVLIEHCHLDQENDQPFYDHDEKLKEFGRLDATAVARYFNLRSESLGRDYRSYQNVAVDVPANVVKPDSTEPDVCMIELAEQDMETGEVTVRVTATDYDSGMLYYTYSYDGEESYTELIRWPDKEKDIFEFTMQVPSGVQPRITVNAYNGYDLYTTSNELVLPAMRYGEEEADKKPETARSTVGQPKSAEAVQSASGSVVNAPRKASGEEDGAKEKEVTLAYFLKVSIVCLLIFLGMVVSMIMILSGRKHRRRTRRR